MKYKFNALVAGAAGATVFVAALLFGHQPKVAAVGAGFVFAASFAWNCFIDHAGKGKS